MLHDLGGALEAGELAAAGDVLAVPLQAELEILVRIETLWIDGKWIAMGFVSLRFRLESMRDLLDLDHDEFGRIERRKADQDVHDSLVDAGLADCSRASHLTK